MSKKRIAWSLIIFTVLLDQALKLYVKSTFSYGEEVSLWGCNRCLLHFVENEGMAFGLSLGGEYGKLLLTVFRLLAVVLIGVYLKELLKDGQSKRGVIIAFSLVLAGAIGNIIDSVFYGVLFSQSPSLYNGGGVAEWLPEAGGYAPLFFGKVVDMFYFPLFAGHYPDWLPLIGGDTFLFFRPVFNVADVAICIGIVLLVGWLVSSAFIGYKEEHKDSTASEVVEVDGPNKL